MVLGVVILITGMIAFGIFVIVLSGDDVSGAGPVRQLHGSHADSQAAATTDIRWIPRLRRIPDVPWRQGHGPLT